jgi:hypothetical protein
MKFHLKTKLSMIAGPLSVALRTANCLKNIFERPHPNDSAAAEFFEAGPVLVFQSRD